MALLLALMKFLEAKNMASLAEATRVFGNLSREATVRDFLAVQKGKCTPERSHKKSYFLQFERTIRI